ncbi:hypothetical protein AVEN_22888-1 [Araneus ventricosus]|uniref:Uncharacterized protein n=1 Tax=Araneus ventricosus TaxID=182803 RepID=A0A4Y2X9B4_ARAVE|nr:hypothetical protein AVEN_22888-1 [Araneus ventricosus]
MLAVARSGHGMQKILLPVLLCDDMKLQPVQTVHVTDHFYSMIRGSLTEPRRKPNHDDVRWGFFLSVNVARKCSSERCHAVDDRTLRPLWLRDGRNSI